MPSISWKKMNDQMPIGRAYITQDSRGLRIDRIQSSDEGEYVCHAKNPAGNIEASAKLRVNSPPTFSKKPEDVRVSSGKPAIFDCEAVGQPQPGIFWSKEGDQVTIF
jgi:roundabout, axon guidance receptor 2